MYMKLHYHCYNDCSHQYTCTKQISIPSTKLPHTEVKCYLKLCEQFLDVSEATLCNVKVFFKCPTFEDRLRSILKELREWEDFSNLLNFSVLKSKYLINIYKDHF